MHHFIEAVLIIAGLLCIAFGDAVNYLNVVGWVMTYMGVILMVYYDIKNNDNERRGF